MFSSNPNGVEGDGSWKEGLEDGGEGVQEDNYDPLRQDSWGFLVIGNVNL